MLSLNSNFFLSLSYFVLILTLPIENHRIIHISREANFTPTSAQAWSEATAPQMSDRQLPTSEEIHRAGTRWERAEYVDFRTKRASSTSTVEFLSTPTLPGQLKKELTYYVRCSFP